MSDRDPAPRVLYVQYTNPAAYPPIQHSAELLAGAGWHVRMLGTDRRGDPFRVAPHPRIRVELMRFEPAGWRQKLHYLRYAARVVRAAIAWRPRWVYASDALACPAALLLSYLPGVRVAYHEHDSPGDDAAQGSGFQRVVLAARRKLARRAALCVLPNAERSARFARDLGRPDVLTVWNCPMPEEVGPARADQSAARLRVLYHGSIVPSRLPPTVLDAVAALPPAVSLDVVGYETVGAAGYVASLKVRAAELGIGDRVRFHGALPERADVMRICRTCDVGLSLQPADGADLNQRMMTGASNKPFDYLACGLALIVSDLPDWRAFFVDEGLAVSCRPASAASVTAALRWMLEHPAERLAMGERGRQRILADWNYAERFAPVLARMDARRPAASAPVAGVASQARG